MRKPKFNQELLNEEIKRFKQINEYSFITSEDDTLDPKKGDVIYGTYLNEEDPEEEGGAEEEAADVEKELGLDDAGEEGGEELDFGDEEGGEELDLGDEEGGEDEELDLKPAGEEGDEPSDELGGEEEVELDVTELVNTNQEIQDAVANTDAKISQLMGTLDSLESKVSTMDDISSRIDALTTDLEKRMPTPVEKLEMRSKDSYPYNLKLTDYWAEKEGNYDAMGGTEDKIEGEPKEYVLTQDDVESDYSESQVKDTFNKNPFEEEDVY